MGWRAPLVDSIMQLIQLHSLTAVNTTFQPARGRTVNTYLHTKAQGASLDQEDLGEFVGDKVVLTYHGKKIKGHVSATYANEHNK